MRFRWGKDAEERRNYGINGISMQILDRRNMRDRKEKAGKFLTGLTRFKGFKDRGKFDRRNMRDTRGPRMNCFSSCPSCFSCLIPCLPGLVNPV
jgi:hypothetical protein